MRTVQDLGRYARSCDRDLRSPLAQPSVVWAEVNSQLHGSNESPFHQLRQVDSAGILQMLEGALGPATGTCILGNNVIGVTGWRDVPLRRQRKAMSAGAGAFVASNMLYLRVIGPDSAHCLSMLTPRNLDSLPVGKAAFAIFTTLAGTVDEEAIVLHVSEHEFILSCGGGKAPSWLPHALQRHPNVTVNNPDIVSCNIKGPTRVHAAQQLLRPEHGEQIHALRPFHIGRMRTLDGDVVWVLKTAVNMEFWGSGEAIRGIWSRILDRPDLVTPCGWDAVNIFRIDCRAFVFAVYPIDMHCGTSLWEIGHTGMATPTKPSAFIGDAALRELKSDRRLWLGGLKSVSSNTPIPPLGEEVYSLDGHFAGHVTTAALSTKYDRPMAFAHLKPYCTPGQSVRVGDELWGVRTIPFTDQF